MVGAFGCIGPRTFPAERFIDRSPRLDVFALHRVGALTPGAVTEIRSGDRGNRLAAQPTNILIDDGAHVQRFALAWCSPLPWINRPVFICACGRGCNHLYLVGGAWACRRCHGLEWRSRHHFHKGHAVAVIRAARLRARLGADPAIFAPLPTRPRHHKQAARHDRLVRRLVIEERSIVGHLGRVVGDLQYRIDEPERIRKHDRERKRNRRRRRGGS